MIRLRPHPWQTVLLRRDRFSNGVAVLQGKEALRQIKDAGGAIVTPRTDIGGNIGAFAVFADPVGNAFGLYEEPKG